jgi:DNA-binding NarL/FixJ family response regulator
VLAQVDSSGGTIARQSTRGDAQGVNGMAPARVLIVDDQDPFRLAAKDVVESMEDFTVVGEAVSGEAAIAEAWSTRPDLILMDVNLPGMDGIEATRRILAQSPGIVVVLLSTYEPARYAARIEASGAVAYVHKDDFGPDRLAQIWSDVTAS